MQDPSHRRAFLKSIDDPDYAPEVSTDAPPSAAVQRTFSPEELESLQEGLAGEFATIAQELASEAKEQEPHDEATAGSDGGGKISVGAAKAVCNDMGLSGGPPLSQARINGFKGMWHIADGAAEHASWIEVRLSLLIWTCIATLYGAD
jgi:hypothetical protein